MNPTIELLKSHRSIRKFTDQPIAPDLLHHLVEAGQAAASSSFLQGVTIIRVTDPAKREACFEISNKQPYVQSAPEFLVFCADLNRAERCCEWHDADPTKGFTEQFIIATVDVALYAQNMVIAAESAGLGICYIGAMRNDPERLSELLALPSGVYPVFGLCLGYPAQDPEPKPRLPLSVVLKDNSYDHANERDEIAAYDAIVRDYYANRTGNPKSQSWSEQMAGLLCKESRPHMREFLRGKGFEMK